MTWRTLLVVVFSTFFVLVYAYGCRKSDSRLSHFNQKLRQNCIRFRTGSKLLRYRGDKIALKSQLVYTRDIQVTTSARQKSPV